MKMKRRTVRVTVLCLAVAALGIGAAPAPAADGCDCHTAVPPTGGAPAAHAPLVASVTACTTCHIGMTIPHSGAPTSAIFNMGGTSIAAGYRLGGHAYDILMLGKSVKRADVTVYLQQRVPGEAVFTDLGRATTNKYGNFGFTVKSPVRYAYYRAIAQGHIVPSRIALPCLCGLPATPKLTLALRGLTNGAVPLGHGITAEGKARPADMAGETILFKVQKWLKTKWVKVFTLDSIINANATYTLSYTKGRGLYRVRVIHVHSADYATARTPWRQWRVQ